MLNEITKPEFIATLPFRSQDVFDQDSNLDVSVWRAPEEICELRDRSPCDTAAGICYGSREDDVTKFCPRHFYELHFGPNAPYRFVDGSGDHQEQ